MYVLVCDLDDDGDLDFVSADSMYQGGVMPSQNPYSIVYYENVGNATNPEFIQHREKKLNPFYDILKHGLINMFTQYEAQLIDFDGDGKCCSH